MSIDDQRTRDPVMTGDGSPWTVRSTASPILLFGLSLATGLPPTEMLSPHEVSRPAVRTDRHAMLDTADLAAILNRPIAEIWCGRVHLGDIDERLSRLETLLQIFRVDDGSGALIYLSTVSPDPVVGDADGASPVDLWRLACEALGRRGVTYGCEAGVGETAFLAVYGGVTAQVAWLTRGWLATASVTSLIWEQARTIEVARSIAAALDRSLKRCRTSGCGSSRASSSRAS